MWSLGMILVEILTGIPVWMSYKCRLKTLHGKTIINTGLLGVQGREGKKIYLKQQQVLKTVRTILKKSDCYGLCEDPDLLDLISSMLEWNPSQRISPSEILQHPFLVN